MDFGETVGLGAIAGFTIYLGLPVGRVRWVDDRLRVCLAMFSVGILAFIFMDVTKHGEAILETAVDHYKHGTWSFAHVLGLFSLLALGFVGGTAGISAAERKLRSRRASPAPVAGGQSAALLSAEQVAQAREGTEAARRNALQTAMVVATAIGLHNFAEGLAIGVSAKAGAVGLATVLIIGFGLHNATEGFGIVGPLGGVRPSWRWLGLAGLVGGGPTFAGTIVGYQVTSQPLELMFYALAGGAVLYVIGEVWTGMRRYGHRTLGLYLIATGFLVGVATDLIISYGGG
ncbi:MAG TPA: ZIP family metal transporter [Solirubrobacteraceae bacterium]|jgi:ZIP family zinc transporter|nr:ZIP family metal transporter [Solirubrobacteraceae bacterium]